MKTEVIDGELFLRFKDSTTGRTRTEKPMNVLSRLSEICKATDAELCDLKAQELQIQKEIRDTLLAQLPTQPIRDLLYQVEQKIAKTEARRNEEIANLHKAGTARIDALCQRVFDEAKAEIEAVLKKFEVEGLELSL